MTTLPPGPHGGEAWRLAGALGVEVGEVLDLSARLNPVAPSVVGLVARHLDALTRYPTDHRATAALAEALDVEVDRVVLTNGGAEAIALVARLLPVGRVDEPDFSLYARHLDRCEPGAPRWRSDPHNPTGRLAPAEGRAEGRGEAFYPQATGRWTRGGPAAVVVGSLTKVFACPGLRLGYVLAPDPGFADRIRAVRPEWSVNGLAAAVVPELLATADLPAWRDRIAELRGQLVDILRRHDLQPEPTDANYVWLPEAAGLRDRLLPHGVLLRAGDGFGAPDAVRIAVPDADGLDRLATALEDIRP